MPPRSILELQHSLGTARAGSMKQPGCTSLPCAASFQAVFPLRIAPIFFLPLFLSLEDLTGFVIAQLKSSS